MIETVKDVVGAVLFNFLLVWVMYELYLSYCTKRQMRDNGRLALMPFIPRTLCYFGLYLTWLLDVFINLTFGTLLFMEIPEIRRLTFTARCSKWMDTGGKRGALADWFCHGWLNPGEPGHCKK